MKEFEPFVDADRAAEFLSIDRETIIRWARKGTIPGHPLGAADAEYGVFGTQNYPPGPGPKYNPVTVRARKGNHETSTQGNHAVGRKKVWASGLGLPLV